MTGPEDQNKKYGIKILFSIFCILFHYCIFESFTSASSLGRDSTLPLCCLLFSSMLSIVTSEKPKSVSWFWKACMTLHLSLRLLTLDLTKSRSATMVMTAGATTCTTQQTERRLPPCCSPHTPRSSPSVVSFPLCLCQWSHFQV